MTRRTRPCPQRAADTQRTGLAALRSSRGTATSRGRGAGGRRCAPRRPRRSCGPDAWPRPRRPAGPPGRRRPGLKASLSMRMACGDLSATMAAYSRVRTAAVQAAAVPGEGPWRRRLSKSVAKASIALERARRIVDIPRFFSMPIPARGAFATDSDTPPPRIAPGAPPAPSRVSFAGLSGPQFPRPRPHHRG